MVKTTRQINSDAEVVDCLCIGTSIIVSLEAIYQKKLGKKVLMVDSAQTFGGAWKTIEIDGIKDVENAIHYFTPNDKGIKFLEDELKWSIEKSKRKFRYFKFFRNHYVKFAYDGVIGKFLYDTFYSDRPEGFIATIMHFLRSLYKVATEPRGASYYLTDGSTGIINSQKDLLSLHQIEIKYNSTIKKLYFDLEEGTVHCQINDIKIICKSLILGHGARLPEIESTDGVFVLNEKLHPRPAFHLVVEDDRETDSLEVILSNDTLIKYVHDVSRFSSLKKHTKDKRKIFVFGLHNHVTDCEELSNKLFRKLKHIGLLGKDAKVRASLFSDVILPTLYDEDLYILKDAVGNLVNVLRTENLSNGVGYYGDRWKS